MPYASTPEAAAAGADEYSVGDVLALQAIPGRSAQSGPRFCPSTLSLTTLTGTTVLG